MQHQLLSARIPTNEVGAHIGQRVTVSLDAELGFIEDHFTVMAVLRDVLAGIMETLGAHYAGDLRLLNARLPVVPEEIPHIHFREAQELIYRLHGADERAEPDLSPQGER
jgi:nondiscriminating aspartyl-tRNA synthetase